jgi:hypothetical protein
MNADYAFYRNGGMSWAVPYVAGLYASACQAKPDITPKQFWDAARKTAVAGKNADNLDKKLGNIINPVGLIEMLQNN